MIDVGIDQLGSVNHLECKKVVHVSKRTEKIVNRWISLGGLNGMAFTRTLRSTPGKIATLSAIVLTITMRAATVVRNDLLSTCYIQMNSGSRLETTEEKNPGKQEPYCIDGYSVQFRNRVKNT